MFPVWTQGWLRQTQNINQDLLTYTQSLSTSVQWKLCTYFIHTRTSLQNFISIYVIIFYFCFILDLVFALFCYCFRYFLFLFCALCFVLCAVCFVLCALCFVCALGVGHVSLAAQCAALDTTDSVSWSDQRQQKVSGQCQPAWMAPSSCPQRTGHLLHDAPFLQAAC